MQQHKTCVSNSILDDSCNHHVTNKTKTFSTLLTVDVLMLTQYPIGYDYPHVGLSTQLTNQMYFL